MLTLQRRTVLGGAIAGAALLQRGAYAQSGPNQKVIPWSDQPSPVPPPLANVAQGITPWESSDSWITPKDKWFSIAHIDRPVIDENARRRAGLSGHQTNDDDACGPEGSATAGGHQHPRMLGQ